MAVFNRISRKGFVFKTKKDLNYYQVSEDSNDVKTYEIAVKPLINHFQFTPQ